MKLADELRYRELMAGGPGSGRKPSDFAKKAGSMLQQHGFAFHKSEGPHHKQVFTYRHTQDGRKAVVTNNTYGDPDQNKVEVTYHGLMHHDSLLSDVDSPEGLSGYLNKYKKAAA